MKETKNLTCINCPMGCLLTVELEDGKIVSVAGNTCKRGEDYAQKEITNPRRTVTSIIPVVHGEIDMVSVKTKTDIPKSLVHECMHALKDIKVEAPVLLGQVILENVCGTGVPVIATKTVRRK